MPEYPGTLFPISPAKCKQTPEQSSQTDGRFGWGSFTVLDTARQTDAPLLACLPACLLLLFLLLFAVTPSPRHPIYKQTQGSKTLPSAGQPCPARPWPMCMAGRFPWLLGNCRLLTVIALCPELAVADLMMTMLGAVLPS